MAAALAAAMLVATGVATPFARVPITLKDKIDLRSSATRIGPVALGDAPPLPSMQT